MRDNPDYSTKQKAIEKILGVLAGTDEKLANVMSDVQTIEPFVEELREMKANDQIKDVPVDQL